MENTTLKSPVVSNISDEAIPPFPAHQYILLLLAIMTAGLAMVLMNNNAAALRYIGFLMLFVSFVQGVIIYGLQVRYLRQFFPKKNLVPQFVLLCVVALVPSIALFIGDVAGAAHYSDEPNGIAACLQSGLVISAVAGAFLVCLFIVGNSIYIKTKGHSRVYKVIATILYYLGCLIAAVSSYIIYGLQYTMHDPNTE